MLKSWAKKLFCALIFRHRRNGFLYAHGEVWAECLYCSTIMCMFCCGYPATLPSKKIKVEKVTYNADA